MNFFRAGYVFATHFVKDWKSPNVGTNCDVIVMVRPGFSRERIGSALQKISAAIEKFPDPNGTAYVPTATYSVGTSEEIAPMPRAPCSEPVVG